MGEGGTILYRLRHRYSVYKDTYILCEIKTARVAAVSVTDLQLSDLTRNPDPELVLCPSGYVTHNFLACDVQSKCWVHYGSSSFSCDAPLSSLPPHFACADGMGHVPYILVCRLSPRL